MDRMIRVKVDGHHLTKDNRRAGIQHEANAAVLRIEFDPGWDGFAKKITFWNADRKHPVERVLTADLLEDRMGDTRIYRCPIPGEAMEEAGELTFIIDGYVGGKRQRSISDTLKVEAAPFIDKAGEPSDPTPSQAEQLQAQVEALLGDIRAEAVRAEEARMVAERARDAAIAIIGGQLGPESFLADKADLVNGKVPVAQLPEMNYAPSTHAIRHKAGGADPLTAADVGAVPALAVYYTAEQEKSADDLTVPLALVPVSTTVNKELHAICGGVFAYVRTNFYISATTTSRRMQVGYSYNAAVPKIAFRIYGANGWTPWRAIADTDYAVKKTGDIMTGNLDVRHGSDPSLFATNTNTGRIARLVSYADSSVRLENHKDGRNYAGIEVKPEADDPTSIARLVTLKDGVWKPYDLLHTGNLHLLDSLVGSAKVKVGSYLGTGAYGGTTPNAVELDFEPDMFLVQDAGMNGAMVWGLWIRGCLMFMSPSTTYASFVQDSGKTFKWASTASAAGQFNSSGTAYGYMAIKFG